MSVVIRAAEAEDFARILDMEQTIFSDAWSERSLLSHRETEGAYTTVAVLDGQVIGYLLANLLPPIGGEREGELYRIAVLPAHRGEGAGRALLQDLLSRLDTCFLEVRDGNVSAIALYERCGFAFCSRRPHYYKNPTEDARIYRYEHQNKNGGQP